MTSAMTISGRQLPSSADKRALQGIGMLLAVATLIVIGAAGLTVRSQLGNPGHVVERAVVSPEIIRNSRTTQEVKMTRHVLCILALGSALVSVAANAGEYRGTAEQRAACTPDAFRLCGDAIPDPKKVQLCLQRKVSQLSPGCRVVFQS